MNNYWLSRKGGAPEGPYAESQIISMWQMGQFFATDLLCMDGTEDWQPASKVLLPPQEPEPLPLPIQPVTMPDVAAAPREMKKRQRRPNAVVSWFFAILGFIILFSFSWWIGLILIFVAILLDKKVTTCGACGNQVEGSSKVCPSCRTGLRGFA